MPKDPISKYVGKRSLKRHNIQQQLFAWNAKAIKVGEKKKVQEIPLCFVHLKQSMAAEGMQLLGEHWVLSTQGKRGQQQSFPILSIPVNTSSSLARSCKINIIQKQQ